MGEKLQVPNGEKSNFLLPNCEIEESKRASCSKVIIEEESAWTMNEYAAYSFAEYICIHVRGEEINKMLWPNNNAI